MKFVSLMVAAAALAGGLGACEYRYEERPAAYYESGNPPGYVYRYGTYRSYGDFERHYNGIDGRGENT
jgi:hypothetical protein